jgi:NAD+ synthase (glutamine-hydrolysing)
MRIALAQLNYKIGDFSGNYQKIEALISEKANEVDLIIFSELCLSGYYPKDLIAQPGFYEAQQEILDKIKVLTLEKGVEVIVGLICKNPEKGKPFYNSLVWISQGQIIYTYHKRLLPVYNIFNEARHFAPGKIPGLFTHNKLRVGFLICEDGWAGASEYPYECDPVNDLSKHPLDLIICINGSPSNVGKEQDRLDRFQVIAKQCHAPLVFVNQVGGNDDIVFDGSSFILDKEGKLGGVLPAFTESYGVITQPPFACRPPLANIELFYHQTIMGLRDYVQKCGFKTVVVGASGGIDSSITLALAVEALGADNVTAIAMPSRYSSSSSLDDAKALCQNLKIPFYVFSIEEEFEIALKRFTEVFKAPPHSLTEQNMQARIRGRLLMEFSNQTGALVLSPGNKSELSVGYTTLYGDMTGGFNLIGDLYKTDVYPLAQYFNQLHPDTPIPPTIFEKAPSAELAPNQKDSDNLPDYAILDPILKLYIEGPLLSRTERKECVEAIQHVPPGLIAKVHAMVDKAEFKRRQAAPIVRVQRRAFGYGRQLPIAATYPTKG